MKPEPPHSGHGRERPAHPIQHIAAFAGPALLPALASEAKKQGVLLEDALSFLPPTRQYNEAEIRQAMANRGVDGVLVTRSLATRGRSSNTQEPLQQAMRRPSAPRCPVGGWERLR
jgi:hypothetical protein